MYTGPVKASPLQVWTGPERSGRFRLAEFLDNPPYSPGDTSGTHFCQSSNRSQRHCAARRIKSMKNPRHTVGNRTRDLSVLAQCPNQLHHRILHSENVSRYYFHETRIYKLCRLMQADLKRRSFFYSNGIPKLLVCHTEFNYHL